MDNMDWLKNLKPGDEIVVDQSNNWDRHKYKIEKVEKITPTGRIKLSDGSQYDPSGKRIGSYDRPLKQITPEILDIIERRKLISQLEFDKFKGLLSADRLRVLLEWQEESLKEE